ncbi:MAG: hypothetical protein ACE5OT_01340 [Candidatus Hadarchaeaceae archaeon]
MKKNELLSILNDSISFEEIGTIAICREITEMIDNSSLDEKNKIEIKRRLNFLIKGSLKHAKMFASLLKEVLASEEDEF